MKLKQSFLLGSVATFLFFAFSLTVRADGTPLSESNAIELPAIEVTGTSVE